MHAAYTVQSRQWRLACRPTYGLYSFQPKRLGHYSLATPPCLQLTKGGCDVCTKRPGRGPPGVTSTCWSSCRAFTRLCGQFCKGTVGHWLSTATGLGRAKPKSRYLLRGSLGWKVHYSCQQACPATSSYDFAFPAGLSYLSRPCSPRKSLQSLCRGNLLGSAWCRECSRHFEMLCPGAPFVSHWLGPGVLGRIVVILWQGASRPSRTSQSQGAGKQPASCRPLSGVFLFMGGGRATAAVAAKCLHVASWLARGFASGW